MDWRVSLYLVKCLDSIPEDVVQAHNTLAKLFSIIFKKVVDDTNRQI
jgi:hypothetical protein